MTMASAGSATISTTSDTFTLAPATLGLSAGDFVVYSVYSETYTEYATAMASSNVNNGDGWDVRVAHTAFGTTGVQTVFSGEITSTASETVTITMSSGTPAIRGAGWPFSTTAGYANIALDTSATVSSSTLDFPSLTPGHGAGELYFCFAYAVGTGFAAGSTSGYSYEFDANSNPLAFNAACGSGAQEPVWTGTASGIYGIAILLHETASSLTATASLTVTPVRSASRVRGRSRSASLTVTPARTAAAAHGRAHTATAHLTVTPVALAGRSLITNYGTAILDSAGNSILDSAGIQILDTSGSASASLVVTPALSATASKGSSSATRTATATVTPARTAHAAHGHYRTATAEVTPARSATASKNGTAHTATASLTVTPVRSATASRTAASHSATASLTVTPVRSASRVRGRSRSASLTVTPARTAAASRSGVSRTATAALTVTPARSASRVHGHSRSASATVTPDRTATAAVTTVPLNAILDEAGLPILDEASGFVLDESTPGANRVTASLTVTPERTATASRGGVATAAGQVYQWNGTNWVPYQWGTSAITPGAVTTDLIAAGAVTASQIAAGTVVAGIVDATTISAATLEGGVIDGGTISGAEVEGGTFNAGTFSGGTFDGGTINAGTINGSNINVNADAGIVVYNDSDETIGTWNSGGLDTTSISINGVTGSASLECDSGHFADNVVVGGTISASNYTSGQGTPETYPLSGSPSAATYNNTINAIIQALQDAGIMTT